MQSNRKREKTVPAAEIELNMHSKSWIVIGSNSKWQSFKLIPTAIWMRMNEVNRYDSYHENKYGKVVDTRKGCAESMNILPNSADYYY